MGPSLKEVIDRHDVLLCIGAGGVGKTTISAAIALCAAKANRPAIVCTIDPAKRLANALGLSELGNEETRISPRALGQAGLDAKLPLFGMMLDMKQTWDRLIERYAPKEARDRILASRFYRSLSTALAGSQEYVALEKLWELHDKGSYGLVVLDTPPTAQALDFLDAPNRILDFLENDAAKWLLTPTLAAGKVGIQLLSLGSSLIAKTLAKFTGAQTLVELAGFLSAMSGLNQGFRERVDQVRRLLCSDRTAFVLVATPSVDRLDEAVRLRQALEEKKMRLSAIVVNRVHFPPEEGLRKEIAQIEPTLAKALTQTLDEVCALAAQDALGIASLEQIAGDLPIVRVPRFELDIHDLGGLVRAARYLSDGPTTSGEEIGRPAPAP